MRSARSEKSTGRKDNSFSSLKPWKLLGSLLIGSALWAACQVSAPPSDLIADREALLAAVDRRWDAYARQDAEGMGRMLDEQAVQIGEKRIEGKAAIVAFMRRWFRGLQIHGWAQTQRSVRLVGDIALVSFWQEEVGLVDGEPYRVAGWVSDVWIRRDGSWLNLMTHIGANQSPPPEGVE